MRIEHLAEFVDLARTLSYTQTAQNMLVSESALSRHIRGLEDELGVVLFERISRRVRLSSHGQLLLERHGSKPRGPCRIKSAARYESPIIGRGTRQMI